MTTNLSSAMLATFLLLTIGFLVDNAARAQSDAKTELNQGPSGDFKPLPSPAETNQSNAIPAIPQQSETPNAVDLDRPHKPLKTGLSQSSFSLGADESMVAWDKWHHRVGKAISKRIKDATHMMIGFVAFDVLITRDNGLRATLITATNRRMGDACVAAAQALNGDAQLQFPAESKRKAVQFRFEYKRGLVLIPKNQYITGDYEHLNDEGR